MAYIQLISSSLKRIGFYLYLFFRRILLYLYDRLVMPKNHRPIQKQDYQRPHGDNRSQRFSMSKVPELIDHIVIGAGISGLSCAAALAKNGKSVLVLEKHDVAGGSIHVFKDHGVEFDTGFHYIGDVHERMPILDFLGQFPMEWRMLGTKEDRYTYDRFHIRDKMYEARAGEYQLIADLVADFPDEKDNIIKYIQAMKTYAKKDLFFEAKIVQYSWLRWILHHIVLKPFYQKTKLSAYEMVSQFTNNDDLKEVLCAMSIDAGPPPSIQSSFMHASIVNHFLEGAYYPVGGASLIPQSLIRTIEQSGGRVLTQAHATELVLDAHHHVQGIMVHDKHFIACPSVISSMGIPNTYASSFIPENIPGRHDFDALLEKVPASVTYFFTYVVLDGTANQLGLRSSNDWIWNSTRFEEGIQAINQDPWNTEPIFFIASSSAKDPTWQERYPDKSVVVVICWAKASMFTDVDEGSSGHRNNPEYHRRKELLKKKCLHTLYKHYPKTKHRVSATHTSTPSTVKHFLGSYAVYGLDATTERFQCYDALRPQTSIPGLWLTGQDITTLGFTGAFMSGILTANAIEGYGSWDDILMGLLGFRRDLITDLMRLEKKT